MEVKHLSFSYGERKILNDVSFTAEYGELLSVLGPNGVGKSTIAQKLAKRINYLNLFKKTL